MCKLIPVPRQEEAQVPPSPWNATLWFLELAHQAARCGQEGLCVGRRRAVDLGDEVQRVQAVAVRLGIRD